jgi:arsenate reductase
VTTPAESVAAEIWFNPACSKCRMASGAFEEAGVGFVVRRYLEDPPTESELSAVLERLGLEPWDIARLGEPLAADLGLESWSRGPASRQAWLAVLAQHPALIQRPIVLASDGSAWVARDEASVAAAISAASAGAPVPP